VVVLMGVSGVGKTTVGQALSKALKARFLEGDTLHARQSISKMRSGIALDDVDRGSWLARLRREIEAHLFSGERLIVACSALKAAHRRTLAHEGDDVRFVFLRGSFNLVSERLTRRPRHFMNPALLRSQLDLLEQPTDALVIDASLPLHLELQAIRAGLRS
jgi:gluconokinase